MVKLDRNKLLPVRIVIFERSIKEATKNEDAGLLHTSAKKKQ